MLSQSALEESVLAVLCFSEAHASFLALKITPALFSTNREHRLIAETTLDYISKYHSPPGATLEYLLEANLRHGEEGKLLSGVIKTLAEKSSQLDPKFVLDNLDGFIENKLFQEAAVHALELAESGRLDEAKQTIHKQTLLPQQGTDGILLQDPKQSLSFLDRNEESEFFSSGVSVLDEKGVRPERKTLMILIAASGRGKSWFLTEVGKAGLQHNHSVLHITLEISEEKTARRYIQSIFSLTTSQAQTIEIRYFEDGAMMLYPPFERKGIPEKRIEIAQRLMKMRTKLFIKEFPTSTLSTSQLAMYLDGLEKEKNFRPDIILLDYADLMQLDTENLRIDTGRLYKELRGLAVSRNCAFISASQGNRESESSKLVTSTNIAEDWSKIGTSDIVLTYSQTAQERNLGLARIFAAKSRDSGDRFLTLISQCYEVGQFCISSTQMTADLANQIQPDDGE
jgi:DnaB-like helicase C terminal domain